MIKEKKYFSYIKFFFIEDKIYYKRLDIPYKKYPVLKQAITKRKTESIIKRKKKA